MKKIIEYFVDNSFVVNTLSLGIVILGLISISSMKRDLIPQWKEKRISVSASLPGATPYQVEQFLTTPLEESIKAFAGIEKLVSTSGPGYVNINLQIKDSFKDVEDLFEKVDASVKNLSSTLPDEVENLKVVNHKMTSFWFSSLSVLNFNENNPIHQKWVSGAEKKLRRIPGIVEVGNWSAKPQIYVKFDADKLSKYEIELSRLVNTMIRRFAFLPLGTIKKNGNVVSVEIENDVKDMSDLENVIVKGNASGNLIRLKDVAKVEYKIAEAETANFTNGVPAMTLVLFKDLDSDIIDMKTDLEKVLVKLNKNIPEELEIIITGDGPSFIERQLNVLNVNGFMGGTLVLLILFSFFGIKSALMTSFGLPLAYLATFTVLSLLNINIDLISVVGMLLIVGILVDDAIIVSELYMQKLELGLSPRESAIKAVSETMIPITGTVLTTIIAFAPILFTESGLSDILKAIPWVVIAALSMSLFECFFLLPNHLAHFVKKPKIEKKNSLFSKLSRVYSRALSFSLKWRYIVSVLLVVSLVGTFVLTKEKVPFKFNLRIGSEKIKIDVVLKKSNSLLETQQLLKPIDTLLAKIDKKKYTYMTTKIGRNWFNGERKEGYRYAGINIRFSQTHENIEADKTFILNLIEKELVKLKTSDFEVLSIRKAKDGYDDKKENIFKLSAFVEGNLRDQFVIDEVKSVFSKVKGIKDVYIDPDLIGNTWMFVPNKEALYTYGLSPIDLSARVQGYVRKRKIKEYRYNGEIVNIYGYFEDGKDLTYDKLNNLKINVDNGSSVILAKLGQWQQVKSLKSISHEDLKRSLNFDLSYDETILKKEKIGEILKAQFPLLKKKIPQLSFALEDADIQEAKNSKAMNKMMISCVLLILFVLALILKSFIQPVIIGMAIPFGLIGVVWAFYFHGQAIDVMAMVGIMGMAGVVVNDSLIMVDTINRKKSKVWQLTREDIHEGAVSRFRAIILTSITTLGGVFPMAYGLGGDSGFTKPLALSMGWGLLFATTLTLFALPSLLEIQRDSWKLINRIPGLKGKFNNFVAPVVEASEYIGSNISADLLVKEEVSTDGDQLQ
ncbi:hypothetical protein A9Q84_06360 [Halobacteriovorax marinus]|uniref:Transmembrane Acr-type transport protein n=1 Tax=Halobacteriovorax marinus TaxID=97084 RepID=A0A1Y5F9V9_9BACT|nr:hypothetical protein A9Q84_06360 [Halobacteriovorax marinus]